MMYHKARLHGSVDACSILSIKFESVDFPLTVESVLPIRQLNDSSLITHLIKREIGNCPALNRLRSYIQGELPKT